MVFPNKLLYSGDSYGTRICSEELTINRMPLDVSEYALKVFQYSEIHWLAY
jgi:hypothetical protein